MPHNFRNHLLGFAALSALPLLASGAGAQTLIENFEFATDNAATSAALTVGVDPSVTLNPVSGSGADANEGTFSLGLDLNLGGAAFESGFVRRVLAAPVALSKPYTTSGVDSDNIADLRVTIDVKGAPAFASSLNTNLWIRLNEADGDIWRYINFSDPALNAATYTDDLRLFGLVDRDGASTGDGNFTEIVSVDLLIQNPDAVAKVGTIFLDDLKVEEPSDGPTSTGLTYVVPLIDPGNAPDVTDSTFDAIFDNGGAHQVITGEDWKDWASRASDEGTPITDNPTSGTEIAATSKAYLLSDGDTLYFGMLVYDPDTSAMTADTGDDTYTKFNVEDIEVAFSALSGAAGVSDAVKLTADAFGNFDDMMPDSPAGTAINTSALTNSNSYIIDANTWAVEWSVGINELVNLSAANLTNTLPSAPGTWYGHIGYQSPFPTANPRVPLYAAGHANGFANFSVEFLLPGPASAHLAVWSLYE
ncbi:MAG: hypothetical protein RLY93_12945 [Sumerlaeia bacterium]